MRRTVLALGLASAVYAAPTFSLRPDPDTWVKDGKLWRSRLDTELVFRTAGAVRNMAKGTDTLTLEIANQTGETFSIKTARLAAGIQSRGITGESLRALPKIKPGSGRLVLTFHFIPDTNPPLGEDVRVHLYLESEEDARPVQLVFVGDPRPVKERPADAVYLAYDDAHNSCMFLGWSDGARFVEEPTLEAGGSVDGAASWTVEHFPLDTPMQGTTPHGRAMAVRLGDKTSDARLGHESITLLDRPEWAEGDGVLFGPRGAPIELVTAAHPGLPRDVDRALRREGEVLVADAIDGLIAMDRPKSYSTMAPSVWKVPGIDSLAVVYPLDFLSAYDDGSGTNHDKHGVLFFLYSLKRHRVVRSDFGHPDWKIAGHVLTIKPEFFFRLRQGTDTYLLAHRYGGNEDWGHAIYNMRTGEEALYCY